MLSERQAQLLDFIIREHVKSAEPIGSAMVCEKSDFELSPATIRNEMGELENIGYLAQPHTSAGRVPTDKAYRWFVNKLMEEGQYEVDPKSRRTINGVIFNSNPDPRELSRNAAQVIQELSDNLVIANIERSPDFYKVGLSRLMSFPEFHELGRIIQLTNMFDQFDELFTAFEREFFRDHQAEQSFNILIGRENPVRDIQSETMIIVKHRLPGGNVGTLTIIGPTRMDYRKNIGLAQYTSKLLDKLSEGN